MSIKEIVKKGGLRLDSQRCKNKENKEISGGKSSQDNGNKEH